MPSPLVSRRACAGLAAVAMAATPAAAQPRWPTRPVRLIVPFAAGGPADICARVVGERLTRVWGQPVVTENRGGAGGNIGADLVAKSPPDGHTLLVATVSLVTAPFLVPNLTFDPMRDFAPVVEIFDYPMVIAIHPSSPVRSVAELIDYARRHPGEVTYSTSGVGNTGHLAPALLARLAGVEMTHVPFAGASQAQTALIAGQVTMAFNNPLQTMPGIRAGQYRAIGVTGETRWRDLPDVPTVAEQGFAGFRASSWMGFLAPAATPEAVTAQIERDTRAAVAEPEVTARLVAAGFEVRNRGRADFRRQMEADSALWGGFIRDAGIRME
ncbi:Bug family tripartite tricarboxylate transporter substrate binding protein [Roseococcus sp.]|uniref:Bug family tripartite tricarboxylate transporter substrate binding protein n=1 Tax=Roseococcus sp. TaxID=2109646 RepID=UPI003BA9450A